MAKAKRIDDMQRLRDLVACLSLERSSLLCVQLAHALGYEISGKPGSVRLDKPGARLVAVYFSADALMDDLLSEARRLIGQRGRRV